MLAVIEKERANDCVVALLQQHSMVAAVTRYYVKRTSEDR